MESEMDMDDGTRQHLEAVEQRLAARIDDLRGDVRQQIERTENNLLSAFYGWARTMEIKVRSLHAFDERLSVVEERLAELERKQHPSQ